MKPAINDVMLAISSSLAASIIVKVTVTLALGLIGAWLVRRSRAAIRHALLAAAFGVLFVLSIVSILAPPLRIAVPAVTQEQTVSTVTWFTEPIPGGPTVTSPGITPVLSRWSGLALSALLTGFWIAGMTLFLLLVFAGLWQVRVLRRSGLPWRRGQSVAEMVAVELGIHRPVELLLHAALPGPMIYGAANPAIVVEGEARKSPIMAMAIRADLATRISALLDSRQRRGRAGTLSVAAACAAALVLVLMMSPLTLVAAPQTLAQVSPVPAQAPPAPAAAAPRVPADPTSAPVPRKLEFEVASVKPVNPGVACCPPQIDSARFAYTTTLHDLIGQAVSCFFPLPHESRLRRLRFPGGAAVDLQGPVRNRSQAAGGFPCLLTEPVHGWPDAAA